MIVWHICQNLPRLGFVEADRVDQLFDFLRRKFDHRLGRIGDGEQAMRCFGRGRVLGAQTENAGDQHAKRAFVGLRHQGHDGRVPLGHFAAQDADRCMNFAFGHGLVFCLSIG